MKYNEPLTLREIADMYDRTVASVKSIIEEVSEKVRANAKRHGVSLGDLI